MHGVCLGCFGGEHRAIALYTAAAGALRAGCMGPASAHAHWHMPLAALVAALRAVVASGFAGAGHMVCLWGRLLCICLERVHIFVDEGLIETCDSVV